MSGFDLYEDGFPHGTREGFDKGCRGGACPAGIEHGLSCRQANIKAHGDMQYRGLVAAGHTPAEIAARLHAAPTTQEAPKKYVRLPEEPVPALQATDDLEEVTEQEEPAMPTPSPATIAAKTPRKSPAGPSQADVRAWAHANGVDVNQRGTIRRDVVTAYLAAQSEPTERVSITDLTDPYEGLAEADAVVDPDDAARLDADSYGDEAPFVLDPPEPPAGSADRLEQIIAEEIANANEADARLLSAVWSEPTVAFADAETGAAVRTIADWISIRDELAALIEVALPFTGAADRSKAAESILLSGWEKGRAA